MAVIEVNENNYTEEVVNSDKTVLIDFNAGWCGPCRMLTPVIHQISDELDGVKIVSVDIDENDELAEKYDVTGIPSDFRKFDIAIPMGISYEYANFVIDARYNLGLIGVFKDESKYRNSVFQFTLGYKLPMGN